MRTRLFITLLFIALAAPTADSFTPLTLGAAPGATTGLEAPDQVVSLAGTLAAALGEVVNVRLFATQGEVGQWLNQSATPDLGLLDGAFVAAHPNEFQLLGTAGPEGGLQVVTRQGVGGELPQRVMAALKGTGTPPSPGGETSASALPSTPRSPPAAQDYSMPRSIGPIQVTAPSIATAPPEAPESILSAAPGLRSLTTPPAPPPSLEMPLPTAASETPAPVVDEPPLPVAAAVAVSPPSGEAPVVPPAVTGEAPPVVLQDRGEPLPSPPPVALVAESRDEDLMPAPIAPPAAAELVAVDVSLAPPPATPAPLLTAVVASPEPVVAAEPAPAVMAPPGGELPPALPVETEAIALGPLPAAPLTLLTAVVEPPAPVAAPEPVEPVAVVEPLEPVAVAEPLEPVAVAEPSLPVPAAAAISPPDSEVPVVPPAGVDTASPQLAPSVTPQEPVEPPTSLPPAVASPAAEPGAMVPVPTPAEVPEVVEPAAIGAPVEPTPELAVALPTAVIEPLKPVAVVEASTPAALVELPPPDDGEPPVEISIGDAVPEMIAQPDLPQELRPPAVPLPRPAKRSATAPELVEEPSILGKFEQLVTKTPKPAPLIAPPDPDPRVIYLIPFVTLMVPPEVHERLFDQFVDTLNQRGEEQRLKFVIVKQALDKIDKNWLATRKHVFGEIFGYVEDSGCCSTTMRANVRLIYYRAHQPEPALRYEYPVQVFFDHDRSNLAVERQKLADQVVTALVNELFKVLQP